MRLTSYSLRYFTLCTNILEYITAEKLDAILFKRDARRDIASREELK